MTNLVVYRNSTIGMTLRDALEELKQQIPEELESKIWESFDNAVCERFKEFNQNTRCKLHGKCSRYNNCDDVWKFILDECEIKGDNFDESSNNCRVVAIDSQNRDGAERREPVRKNRRGGLKRSHA